MVLKFPSSAGVKKRSMILFVPSTNPSAVCRDQVSSIARNGAAKLVSGALARVVFQLHCDSLFDCRPA
jgi:hypothetical protein